MAHGAVSAAAAIAAAVTFTWLGMVRPRRRGLLAAAA